MKTIFVLFLVLIALAFAAEEKSYSNQGTPYAQLSAPNSQRPANCDQPESIRFVTESINRVKLNGMTTLEIKSSGIYYISVTPQVNRLGYNTSNDNVDFWLRINGGDVPNSARRLTLHDILTTDVTTVNGIYALKKGDTIDVRMNVVCNIQPNVPILKLTVGTPTNPGMPTNVNQAGTYSIGGVEVTEECDPNGKKVGRNTGSPPAVSLSLYKI